MKIQSVEEVKAEEQRRATLKDVKKAISKNFKVKKVISNDKIMDELIGSRIDVVFNLSTGIRGESRQSQIPAVLEMLGIAYVGSGVLAHGIALNKVTAKKLFNYHNVPTPYFQEFYTGVEKLDPNLRFPLMIKPACEGSGFGIHRDSFAINEEAAYRKIQNLLRGYRAPTLVEEYIDGREFTVGILGNGEKKTVLPILEIDFQNVTEEYDKFNTFESKSGLGGQKQSYCPAILTIKEIESIEKSALGAFDALGCRDFARVDIRVRDGIPYVLEVNSLPGLMPGYSDFPKMAKAAGMTYEDMIMALLWEAIKRVKDVGDHDTMETGALNT